MEAALVQEWIAAHGAPRRFEPGVSAEFEYLAPYLRDFDIHMRMHDRRCEISQNGGPWRRMKRHEVISLVDQLRAAQGLEPIRIAR